MNSHQPNFIHAADLHLGAPLQSLGAKLGHHSDRLAELRRLASRSLDNLVDAALERQAAFVVMSGDVYDTADREVSSQLSFDRSLRRLQDADIRVFVVHGNHDPIVDGFSGATRLPENVHVFGSGEPSSVVVDVADAGSVNVVGVSFSTQSEADNLVSRFSNISVDRSLPTIGVVHANVEGTTGHDPYAPCSKDDLETSPVDYWALGHVHKRTVASMGPGRWWAYPGNLQGRSTKPAECGAKGVLSVGIVPGGFAGPEFIACDSVRFLRLPIDVSDVDDLGEMIRNVADGASEAAAAGGSRPVLMAVELVGRTPLRSHIRALSPGTLLDQCREELGESLGLSDVLRIRDSTLPDADLGELSKGTGLLSEVLRFIERIESGDDPDLEDQVGGLLTDSLDSVIVEALGPDTTDGSALSIAGLLDASRQILVDELLEAMVD